MKKRKRAPVALGIATAIVSLLAGCSTIPESKHVSSQLTGPTKQTVTLKTSTRHSQVPTYEMKWVSRHRPDFYVNLQKDVYYSNRVMVVSFHDMSLHLKSKFNMSPAVFEQDLQVLRQYHFNVISNQQYIGWMQHRNLVPPNAVLLTFDDGYKSMYTHAFPILRKYHMTGTFFIITHAQDVGFPGFMTWPEVQAMEKARMSMESHTYDLHYEVKVDGKLIPAFNTAYYHGQWQTQAQYFARDYHDFLTARLQLQQHLGHPINEIAWPYGYGYLTAYRAAQAAGYQYFFTTDGGVDTPWTSPWYIRRIDVGLYSNPVIVINKILQTAGSPVELVPVKPNASKVHSV